MTDTCTRCKASLRNAAYVLAGVAYCCGDCADGLPCPCRPRAHGRLKSAVSSTNATGVERA